MATAITRNTSASAAEPHQPPAPPTSYPKRLRSSFVPALARPASSRLHSDGSLPTCSGRFRGSRKGRVAWLRGWQPAASVHARVVAIVFTIGRSIGRRLSTRVVCARSAGQRRSSSTTARSCDCPSGVDGTSSSRDKDVDRTRFGMEPDTGPVLSLIVQSSRRFTAKGGAPSRRGQAWGGAGRGRSRSVALQSGRAEGRNGERRGTSREAVIDEVCGLRGYSGAPTTSIRTAMIGSRSCAINS